MGKPREDSPYRLLVEGTDDQSVIVHLLKRHGYDWDNERLKRPYVRTIDGVEKLPKALAACSRGFPRLGIVLDADQDLSSRWQQVRSQLERYGIQVPAEPDPAGTTVQGVEQEFKVGIWLMPDNRSTGALEHFIEKLVPAHDACWHLAHEAATTARDRYGEAACPQKDALKSRLSTWLAWQREPGRPYGTALTARFFEHDSPSALAFLAWFQQLFPTAS